MKQTYTITTEHDGWTIKQFCKEYLNYSTRHLAVLKFTYDFDGISVNGNRQDVRYTLKAGDKLTFTFYEEPSQLTPWNMPLCVYHQDEYLYVVEKPHGIPSHPDRAHQTNTLGNALKHHFDKAGLPFTLHVATRLDKQTSGIVLGATNSLTKDCLVNMLKSSAISKTYVALVDGVLCGSGQIDAPLTHNNDNGLTELDTNGKSALTQYTVLANYSNTTLVQLNAITGRTHQLRAHLCSIGHPIVGDTLYGGSKHSRLCLHMHKLEFVHPHTNEQLCFTSPVEFDYDKN